MNTFDYKIVEDAAKELYIRALCDLPPDVRAALQRASEKETNPTAKEVFKAIFKTIEIADKNRTLICQDTGLPIYMVKVPMYWYFEVSWAKAQKMLGYNPQWTFEKMVDSALAYQQCEDIGVIPTEIGKMRDFI